jgi:hypothetical protein
MVGVGGAAVSGRLSQAGTEARPTNLFSYKKEPKRILPVPQRIIIRILSVARSLTLV